ncbi:MAG TPA: c-type cytochrome domain-containing protein, partial [Patescibacteria group bacterium]|nr:c-type cytochrome domain-containing protein [Patescibacteria group bacterium]
MSGRPVYQRLGLAARVRFILLLAASVVAQAPAASAIDARAGRNKNSFRPEFDRDIRPILAENCYPCHGPDQNKRKARLRLDRSEDATKMLPDGEIAIVPGKPRESKLVERISAKDPDDVMPPAKSGKKLSAQEIDWITRWIEDGAKWQNHWSFVAPRKSVLPVVNNKRWARNEI